MKKLLSLILFLNIVLVLYSQENNTAVNINKIDGSKITFLIVNQPHMSFSSDSVTITEAVTGFTVSYHRQEIEDVTFDKNIPSDIISSESHLEQLVIKYTNANIINVYGIDKLSNIRVFDISGKLFSPDMSFYNNNTVQINISELPSGIYIVNVKGTSFKIKK